MKKKLFFLNTLIIMLSVMLVSSPAVFAENIGGGQVTVKGKITFKEAAKNSFPDTENSAEEKKSGRLPQTGEARNDLALFGGGILLTIVLVCLWLLSRNREGKS